MAVHSHFLLFSLYCKDSFSLFPSFSLSALFIFSTTKLAKTAQLSPLFIAAKERENVNNVRLWNDARRVSLDSVDYPSDFVLQKNAVQMFPPTGVRL